MQYGNVYVIAVELFLLQVIVYEKEEQKAVVVLNINMPVRDIVE